MEKKKSSTGLRYVFAGVWFMLFLCLMVLIPGRVLAEEDKGEYLDSFEWTDSQGITWEGDAYEKEATLIRCDKGVRELTLPAYIEYKGKQIPVRDVGLDASVHDTRPSGFDPQGIQPLFKGQGRRLSGKPGEHHGAYIQSDSPERVDQAQCIRVVRNPQIAADLALFNIIRVKDNDDFLAVLQLQQHLHLAVRLKSRQHPACVVIVKKLTTQFQIKFPAKLFNPVQNPL